VAALGHVKSEEHPKWLTDALDEGLSALGGYHPETGELEIRARMYVEREIIAGPTRFTAIL
jgi:hypothetical protein